MVTQQVSQFEVDGKPKLIGEDAAKAYSGRGRWPKALGERTHKRCSACGVIKLKSEFHSRRRGSHVLQAYCKSCASAKSRKWARENRDRHRSNGSAWRTANAERVRELAKRQYYKDQARSRALARNGYHRHAEKRRAARRNFCKRSEVREKTRAYEKQRRASNPNAKLAHRLRERLRQALRGKVKSGSAVKLLGCSIDEARAHIEAQFAPGMSWENAGVWHVDHIKPLASFDLEDPDQLAEACCFKNLQPLWAPENQRKGARILNVAVADLR